jgi:fructose/tagatose bisphosphate aldolase
MKKTEYYCDACNSKVNVEDDLKQTIVYSDFKNMQDNPYPYDTVDLCNECFCKIEKAIYNTFHNIKSKKGDI